MTGAFAEQGERRCFVEFGWKALKLLLPERLGTRVRTGKSMSRRAFSAGTCADAKNSSSGWILRRSEATLDKRRARYSIASLAEGREMTLGAIRRITAPTGIPRVRHQRRQPRFAPVMTHLKKIAAIQLLISAVDPFAIGWQTGCYRLMKC